MASPPTQGPPGTAPGTQPAASSAPATGFGARPFDQTTRSDDEHPDDDAPDDRPRHPYTWLHLIVLALVAFVLGFLITLLLIRDDDAGAAPVHPSTSATAPTTVPLSGTS